MDVAYEVVCCHAIALAMATDLLSNHTDKSGTEWRLVLTHEARKFFDSMSDGELEIFLAKKYPFVTEKSE